MDGTGETWNTFPSAIWQPNTSVTKLPVKWIINKAEFESLDSVSYGIQNLSNSKFYYMSWGDPNSRIRNDYFVYKNGIVDTIAFSGFGCSTGIYLAPIKDKETAMGSELNPLLSNIYSGYNLDLKSDSFPTVLKSSYGDSVGIRFSLPTYSLPWSQYEPQMIESEIFMVHTDKLINNWKKQQLATAL